MALGRADNTLKEFLEDVGIGIPDSSPPRNVLHKNTVAEMTKTYRSNRANWDRDAATIEGIVHAILHPPAPEPLPAQQAANGQTPGQGGSAPAQVPKHSGNWNFNNLAGRKTATINGIACTYIPNAYVSTRMASRVLALMQAAEKHFKCKVIVSSGMRPGHSASRHSRGGAVDIVSIGGPGPVRFISTPRAGGGKGGANVDITVNKWLRENGARFGLNNGASFNDPFHFTPIEDGAPG